MTTNHEGTEGIVMINLSAVSENVLVERPFLKQDKLERQDHQLLDCVYNDEDNSKDNLNVEQRITEEPALNVAVLQPSASDFSVTINDILTKQKQWKSTTKKSTRLYYRKLDRLIESLKNADAIPDEFDYDEIEGAVDPRVSFAAKISFFFNLLLFAGKIVAAVLSGSLSIVSSVIDSAVDLTSGVVIWYSNRAIRLTNIYSYPLGRNRLEPIAILLLSTIMGSASVLMVRESAEKLINGNITVDLKPPSISIVVVTIVCKFGLFIYCRLIKSPSTKVLALDHRNDVISNSFALCFSALATYEWKYVDPIGAILISVYIFVNWWREGSAQIRNLSGHTAPTWFLQIITWMCLQHSPHIIGVDTVKASSIGTNYLVEVHIALPRDMLLNEAHDIGETLQRKIENLSHVERAFVHLDYECLHDPKIEHKPIFRKRDQSSGSVNQLNS